MIITGCACAASAQTGALPSQLSPQAVGYLNRARTMMATGNYLGVIDQLETIRTRGIILPDERSEESEYLLAMAYYERDNRMSLDMLKEFVAQHPASPLASKANLTIADWYFFHHQWKPAAEALEKIKVDNLNSSESKLYTYRRALSQIKAGEYADASLALNKIAKYPEYANAAKFYEAYLEYEKGNYDAAYTLFGEVTPADKGLNPAYYTTQIEYLRGDYAKVADTAPRLIEDNEEPALTPELNRIAGLSLFKNGEYMNARKYLADYEQLTLAENPDTLLPTDVTYALGVCDYQADDYQAAAQRFALLTDLKNDIGQSAWLYLGQCDMHNGNDDAAAIAFEQSARMDLDQAVAEVAMYNYVAALTRGGKVPFSSSANVIEGFIKLYPNSQYTPKVEEYLATAYYNDRNYAKALESIEKITSPSKAVLAAKQKILYELGVTSMTNGNPAAAVEYLRRSLELGNHDRNLASMTQLWLGDALYSKGDFAGASTAYRAYLKNSSDRTNRALATYNLAYAEYQQDLYSSAISEFKKAMDTTPALAPNLRQDALVRMADCHYYNGDFRSAKNIYTQAIDSKVNDADYATYRYALMLGLEGNLKGKLATLESIATKYPSSKWIPNAILEKALTHESNGNRDLAAQAFKELAASYPKSAQARKGMLNLAISYTKAGKTDEAVETYREVIRNWPTSEEAVLAVDDLKKYYAEHGGLQEYAAFLRGIQGAPQLDIDEMEKLVFDGAETAFAEDMKNTSLLEEYVKNYPDGKYLAPALLDIATSLNDNNHSDQALSFLNRLIESRPHSAQYPEALWMKGRILEEGDEAARKEAVETYRELEKTGNTDFISDAYAGIARNSSDPTTALEYAEKARNSGGVSGEIADEMDRIEAEILIADGKEKEGVEILKRLAAQPTGLQGSKAAVALGRYYISRKNYKQAEKEMLSFIDSGTPHMKELAQGFFNLADAYQGMGKTYLAKEYMLQVKEGYPGNEPEILNGIESRLKSYK